MGIDLEHFRKLIDEEIKKCESELKYTKENQAELRSDNRDTNTFLKGDRKSNEEAIKGTYLQIDSLNKNINNLKNALLRIENGTYGICFICKKTIPILHLEKILTNTRCNNCIKPSKK